ncbi:SGNH/GDSL hydrolase family protein [Vibrio olivae]|uniref:SGNH/GDSL hydrolase family protein n=1 Tax=Vibrio olivae TaxID=1243002 RepID=A0ABV5HHW0_9VIBR
MTPEQLLRELEQHDYLDLAALYERYPDTHFYSLVEALYRIKAEHGLNTRISRFITEIEKLTQDLDAKTLTAEQFLSLTKTLDLNQRAQKAARFIHTKDNHMAFSKPVDVVMFGDSITEWGPWHDGINGVSVANRGLGGDTTQGMIMRLESTIVCQPKLVCVMAGINDLAQGYTIDEIIHNYGEMLRFWHQHDIDVWVQSTLHVGERLASLNPLVAELNQRLYELCQQREVTFIDLNSQLCPQGELPLECSADDLHLNSQAYTQWLAYLNPKLAKHFGR